MHVHINETPKRHIDILHQTASFEPSCKYLCAMLDSVGIRSLEKISEEKVTDLFYFLHAWVRPYSAGGDGSCTFRRIINIKIMPILVVICEGI
jgi:hypothetical protein